MHKIVLIDHKDCFDLGNIDRKTSGEYRHDKNKFRLNFNCGPSVTLNVADSKEFDDTLMSFSMDIDHWKMEVNNGVVSLH